MRYRSLAVGQFAGSGQGAPEVSFECGSPKSGASQVHASLILNLHGLFRPNSSDKGLVKVSYRENRGCTDEGIDQAIFIIQVGCYHLNAAFDESLSLCATRVASNASDLPAGIG
ncbi:hypothetical protein HG530_011657 [Fusarium avenaceum]|nr:hypothetical protein HG530_011657 [Fusarium avenaceum]